MKLKSKKSALLLSFTSLLLCFAMLAGSTFAWFTDTATTGVNKITSGNLDIKLSYKNSSTQGGFKTADKDTPVFDENARWEPGHVEYVVLKVSNEGNLALKYKLGINIAKEAGSTNVHNDKFMLSDYINFAVIDDDQSAKNRDDLVAAATGTPIKAGYTGAETPLYPKVMPVDDNQPSEKIVTLVVWMPKTVDNKANHKADAPAPSVELGINVVATQLDYENDSYGPDYDKDAPLPLVATRNELNTAITRESLKAEGKIAPVEVTLGNLEAEDIQYTENKTGYTGKGVMLGNTNLNRYNAEVPEVGAYSFTFKDGVINSAAGGYIDIDHYSDTAVLMLVPGNSDVVFENMTFNGVISFDIQKYTSPWSNLNSISFKNCTFNGIIIGTCPASNVTFDGCTFKNYTNTNETKANNSNPIWWREDTEGSGANANPIKTFTFVNNKVTSTRPVKIERIGKTVSPIFTIKNNEFDISRQAGDTETKNMAINIGMGENPNLPFTLIDEGNTISSNTAALYTVFLGSGSNKYKEISGMKVLDGNGNNKTITALVWKTTTGETFEMKTID